MGVGDLTVQQVAEIKEAFDLFDTDNSGIHLDAVSLSCSLHISAYSNHMILWLRQMVESVRLPPHVTAKPL